MCLLHLQSLNQLHLPLNHNEYLVWQIPLLKHELLLDVVTLIEKVGKLHQRISCPSAEELNDPDFCQTLLQHVCIKPSDD
jgi:hypothetical protein